MLASYFHSYDLSSLVRRIFLKDALGVTLTWHKCQTNLSSGRINQWYINVKSGEENKLLSTRLVSIMALIGNLFWPQKVIFRRLVLYIYIYIYIYIRNYVHFFMFWIDISVLQSCKIHVALSDQFLTFSCIIVWQSSMYFMKLQNWGLILKPNVIVHVFFYSFYSTAKLKIWHLVLVLTAIYFPR